ncbi:MAG: glycosyltransferase family 2 protein [Acidobacteriota bacterium]|nr:glycosyltransferase family 2 protein [Acidobacteriota bacterium]
MNARPALAIVIPAYNEAAGIEASVNELRSYLASRPWTWEIRIVDDGSTDRTAAIVETIERSDPRVRLQREPHRGKGAAVRAGFLASTADYRFLCDADLSMPVHELVRFMPPALGDADIAIGTREGAGARRVGEPLSRHLAGRAFNAVVRTLTVPGIQDTQCGFKMFTAAATEAIFSSLTVDGWAFDIEVLYVARLRGLRIREVPIEWHFRADSRLRMFPDSLNMLREVFRIRLGARRGVYDTARLPTR